MRRVKPRRWRRRAAFRVGDGERAVPYVKRRANESLRRVNDLVVGLVCAAVSVMSVFGVGYDRETSTLSPCPS
jgi:hypothetical protein